MVRLASNSKTTKYCYSNNKYKRVVEETMLLVLEDFTEDESKNLAGKFITKGWDAMVVDKEEGICNESYKLYLTRCTVSGELNELPEMFIDTL